MSRRISDDVRARIARTFKANMEGGECTLTHGEIASRFNVTSAIVTRILTEQGLHVPTPRRKAQVAA